jgi:general secretion pathway protein C
VEASERIADEAVAVKRDVGYACRPARGRLAVRLKHGYSVEDVAAWYLAVTCNSVVVPKYAISRRAKSDVDAVVEANEIDALLQSALAALDLAAATQAGVTVFFDNRDGVIEAARRGEPRIALVPAPIRLPPPPDGSRASASVAEAEAPAPVTPGVRRLSETHYEVEAAFRDRVFGDPTISARGARIVPSIKDGKANGFKLYAIRPSSWYAQVGFRNGDTVHAINGYELTTPDVAMDALQRIENADHFELDITRRGKKILLVIDVK